MIHQGRLSCTGMSKTALIFWDVCVRAGPTSNLPAVWRQYQTPALNYSKHSDGMPLFFFSAAARMQSK